MWIAYVKSDHWKIHQVLISCMRQPATISWCCVAKMLSIVTRASGSLDVKQPQRTNDLRSYFNILEWLWGFFPVCIPCFQIIAVMMLGDIQGLYFEDCSRDWLAFLQPFQTACYRVQINSGFFLSAKLCNCETEAFSPASSFSSLYRDTVCLCVLFLPHF